jgi:hypothetical protein
MKLQLLILASLLLTACENQPVRREEMVSQHPEWDKDTVTFVRNGYLAVGMNQDQVKAAWGRPCLSCTGTTKSAWGEAWEYATQVVFFDAAGKVTRWTKK